MQNDFTQAIIYVRFSDEGQRDGDSIDRQLRDCRKFCADRGWTVLGEPLIDGDRSAFKGRHLEDGAHLAKLKADAELGILGGTIIVAERLDRLSRLKPEEGYDLIRTFTKNGVSIATVDGAEIYEAGKPLNMGQIMIAFAKLFVAHEESAKKSQRVREGKASARAKARNQGRTFTKVLPLWITLDEHGNRVAIPERAEIVRQIFVLVADQGMGKTRVVRWLHANNIKPWGTGKRASDGWHQSYIGRILSNRAVLGEFQPHTEIDGVRVPDGDPIGDYFPKIVDAELFERVNAGATMRKAASIGRKSEKVNNLFSGLVRCSHCDGPVRYRAKSAEGSHYIVRGKRYARKHADASLVCSAGERHVGCDNDATLAYHTFETAVLDACLHLAMDDQVFSNRGEVARLNNLIAERRRDLEIVKARSARFWRAWAEDESEDARALAKEAETQSKEILTNVTALERQLESAQGRVTSEEHLLRVGEIRDSLYDPDLAKRIPQRRKVAQALQGLIQRMNYDGERVVVIGAKEQMLLWVDRKGNVSGIDLVHPGRDAGDLADYQRRALKSREVYGNSFQIEPGAASVKIF